MVNNRRSCAKCRFLHEGSGISFTGGLRSELRELQFVEMPVAAVFANQFLMRSPFDDGPLLEHHDPVSLLDRGQPVGDHQAGAPRKKQESFSRME